MSEVKIELMQFTNRPNGLEYSYRVYTESAALARKINHSLKWNPLTSKYTRYTTGDEPYLYISDTLTTPEELQAIIDSLSTETKSEPILPEKVEDLGGWLILTLTNKEKTPDLDKAAVILSEAMVKEYGWSLTDAVHIFAYAMTTATQSKHCYDYPTRISCLAYLIKNIQKGYN